MRRDYSIEQAYFFLLLLLFFFSHFNIIKNFPMVKHIIYSNLELRKFLDQSNYDTINIEGIQWRIDRDSNCIPYVLAKLIAPLPIAVAQQKYFVYRDKKFPFNPSLN